MAAPVHQCDVAVLQGDLRRRVRVRPAHLLHPPRRAARRRPRGLRVSPVHDYHNVSDCGLDTWREGNTLARELPAHAIGHSVESANNGVHGSPAYEIWGDSKWAEFYIYDLYTALGMDREARDVFRRFTGNTDDFPRRGTRWFRDWLYPLWRDCGRAEVMNRFFRELARHFPRDSRRHLYPADELGRVRPLHQRCRGRRHERPGRPRFRLAPRAGQPASARPRAVPRDQVLKYRAVANRESWPGAGDCPGHRQRKRPSRR